MRWKLCWTGAIVFRFLDASGEFRCSGCIDKYDMAPSASWAADRAKPRMTAAPANWWACQKPPLRLADVADGLLEFEDVSLTSAGGFDCAERFLIVTDPSHTFFSGHGAAMWPASLTLSEHVLTWPWTFGLRAVELGAGCGLVGLALARRGVHVTLTDVPWLVPLAQYNIEANSSGKERVQAAALRWGNLSDVRDVLAVVGGPPDVVLASDVVYREADFHVILDTIFALQCREAVFAVRQREDTLQKFLRAVQERAWHARIASVDYSRDASFPTAILELSYAGMAQYACSSWLSRCSSSSSC
jgi:predicted nicotinamide N-methyase